MKRLGKRISDEEAQQMAKYMQGRTRGLSIKSVTGRSNRSLPNGKLLGGTKRL